MTADPGEPDADIMEATLRAVCRHGYADVTMQDIADEFEKSKSLLHYHYDTKEDLLVAFLEHLVDQYEDNLEELVAGEGAAVDRLKEYIDWFSVAPDETERTSLHLALLEMRSQAQHNPRIREQFRRSDRMARAAFATLIEAGQAEGTFEADADAESLAQLCFVTMDGARARQVTLDEPGYARDVGETLLALLQERLGYDIE